ncbi:MAG: DUF362 domain-containing protein [Candidatus Eisenbacteria bacterium]|uniref:DUF362 domain-containing protein n=1 Tax=Eiseniibacteriota bacterium TaxID=2212470 RepID=A0A937XA17_UNCEI|nr:DUF362 domain-containing protein [Candidatus Eisenbacteria bacterium]
MNGMRPERSCRSRSSELVRPHARPAGAGERAGAGGPADEDGRCSRRQALRRLAWGAAGLTIMARSGAAAALPGSAGAGSGAAGALPGSAGAGAGAAGGAAGSSAAGAAAAGVRLAVIRHGAPDELTRRALAALGGMSRFVSAGNRVVIKPNIGWDRVPEQAANTHPEVVAALVRMALEAGAKRVTVMDHTCNDARRCYARSGIEAAARAAGADVVHLPDGRGTEMDIGGETLRAWPVHREVIETDVLINAPIAKHHSLTQASLGMKNWLGAVDGRRNQLHQRIDAASVDLAAFFKPALTVLDATRILLRNGPQGGNLDDVAEPRIVAAGTDPVAVDLFGAGLFDLAPEDFPLLALAEARGLGRPAESPPDLIDLDLEG